MLTRAAARVESGRQKRVAKPPPRRTGPDVAGADLRCRPYRSDPAAENSFGRPRRLRLRQSVVRSIPSFRGVLFEGSGLTQEPLHVVALEIGKRPLVAVRTEPGPADSFLMAPTDPHRLLMD